MGVIRENADAGFLKQIDVVRGSIRRISEYCDELEKLHRHALTTLYADDAARTSRDIEELTLKVSDKSNGVRRLLKKLGAENEQLATKANRGDADLRIRSNQVAQSTKKFMDIMRRYQDIQTTYKQKCRQQLQRQYKIVRPDASEEELEKVVESKGSSLMSQQIFTIANADDAQQLIEDMQDRHNDIMVLEKSILELHQLFVDMSLLVEQQGDMINTIESQVEQAADYTGQAVVELRSAVQHQKNARKKRWCIIILLLILIAVGGGLLYFYVIQPMFLNKPTTSTKAKSA
jgi:t-SNARE complex subunit (syntaxin)